MGHKVSLFSLVSIDLHLLPEAISSSCTPLTISYECRKLKKKIKFDFGNTIQPSLKKCAVAIPDLVRHHDFKIIKF